MGAWDSVLFTDSQCSIIEACTYHSFCMNQHVNFPHAKKTKAGRKGELNSLFVLRGVVLKHC